MLLYFVSGSDRMNAQFEHTRIKQMKLLQNAFFLFWKAIKILYDAVILHLLNKNCFAEYFALGLLFD